MSWFLKICQRNQVIIEMDDYIQKCQQAFMDLVMSSRDRNYQLQNFQLDITKIQQLLGQVGYPDIQNVVLALKDNDHETMMDTYSAVYNWSRTNNLTSQQYDALFEAVKQIRNHMDKTNPYEYGEEDAQQSANKAIQTTLQNMNIIKQSIEEAISRIPTWQTPIIRIVPNPSASTYSMKDDFSEPSTSALVEFGRDEMAPNFSYFLSEEGPNIEIDDVLEAGDTDFFTTPQMQQDYFSLIRELKNPGSSQRQGKRKTLYTARPVEDRQIYLNNQKIPTNIFLSSNYYDAEGIASDLSSRGRRDIWKVVIDDRYLIQTLDAPTVKHYQAVGNEWIPVHSLQLINVGN